MAISNPDDVEKLRDQTLKPIADKFGFPISKRSGGACNIPTVLCLGNHSSGKSSFINELVGKNVQATGVAPTDDGFTLLVYGDQEQSIDGRTAVIDPQLPLKDFEQYGKELLDHLKVRRLPLEPLRKTCLIDSPGLIDHAGTSSDHARGYDFPAVVREFAGFADLIVFFFDPGKPGTTGESLRIITDALSDVMYKVLIVFNKVDSFEDVRDFARTYGALCWNLSRVIRTKDMPQIYCTFVEGLSGAGQRQIDLVDFTKATQELRGEIGRVNERRRSNLIGSLLDTTRSLRIHATVCHKLGVRMMWMRIIIGLAALALFVAGVAGLWSYRTNSYLIAAELIAIAVAVGSVLFSRAYLRHWLEQQTANLDTWFNRLFHREMLEQSNSRFLEGLWQTVKPRTVKFLQTVGPSGVPFSPLWVRKISRLRKISEVDIPQMLKSSES